jgi:SAM-dependent methyltransferase
MSERGSVPDAHFDSLQRNELTYWWHHSRLLRAELALRSRFPDPGALRVLDYGCGTGGFLHQLQARLGFARALGVDVSGQALAHARRLGDRYRLVEPGDFSAASDADLVTLMDVLEHVEDDQAFLMGLAAAMPPGAHLLLTVPAMPALFSTWDEALGHHRRYTVRRLARLAAGAGLRTVRVERLFSYLAPAVVFRRLLANGPGGDAACEFPPTGPAASVVLRLLNRLEMHLLPPWLRPMGTSLLGLFATGPGARA